MPSPGPDQPQASSGSHRRDDTHAHGAHRHGHNECRPHDHGHPHRHAPADFGRAFLIGIVLNTGFVLIEATFGILSHSMALLADAGHNLSDVLGLAVAWIASVASRKPPTERWTFGLRKTSILAALVNGTLTLIAAGAIAVEAIQRMLAPAPVATTTVMIVAAIGAAINLATAMLFASGRAGDLNIRGAFLHMAADAAVSVGVVVAGLAIAITGWFWLDPATSLLIVAIIIVSAWSLVSESTAMTFAAVPRTIDPAEVRGFLAARPGVQSLHDLHIWPMSTTEIALTAHLVMPEGHPGDGFLTDTAQELAKRFGIGHMTLQIEVAHDNGCVLAPEDVV